MKLDKLIGKHAIRTAPGPGGDRTYLSTPVAVDSIVDGVIYIKDISDQNDIKIKILEADYNDENWAPVSNKYTKQLSEAAQ